MAAGVPVVLPAHGSFPELIEETGGGLLCKPGDPAELATTLKSLLLDPARGDALGKQGHDSVHRLFTASAMAERTRALYRELVSQPQGAEGRTPEQPAAES